MDLLIDDGEKVIPIEVKVEENFRVKSLKMYREKYDSAVCVRTSMANYRDFVHPVGVQIGLVVKYPHSLF